MERSVFTVRCSWAYRWYWHYINCKPPSVRSRNAYLWARS